MTDLPPAPGMAPSMRIVAGNPTPEELAAVTAVLAHALDEASAEQALDEVRPSTWDRSRAAMRPPLHPGHGAWRAFSG
jgi:hypothetical protein